MPLDSSVSATGAIFLWHWNDNRATAAILYSRSASNNDRVRYARVDKDVGDRRLEASQIVRDERVVPRDSPILIDQSQRSSSAPSNSVIERRVALTEALDFYSRAVRAEDDAFRRRHSDIVVRDDGARLWRHRRGLAHDIDAYGRGVAPTAIYRIVRYQKRTRTHDTYRIRRPSPHGSRV